MKFNVDEIVKVNKKEFSTHGKVGKIIKAERVLGYYLTLYKYWLDIGTNKQIWFYARELERVGHEESEKFNKETKRRNKIFDKVT